MRWEDAYLTLALLGICINFAGLRQKIRTMIKEASVCVYHHSLYYIALLERETVGQGTRMVMLDGNDRNTCFQISELRIVVQHMWGKCWYDIQNSHVSVLFLDVI